MTAIPAPDDAPNTLAQDHEHGVNAAWIFATFVGGALILNSYLASVTYERGLAYEDKVLSGLCALVGALFLSFPIVTRAVRDLLAGKRNMSELAALAVLACFATGKYQEAGLVAFFLLMAELLENRSALGAKAAVEGLIRLTPNEAHLIDDKTERDVLVTTLKPGNLIRIRPGENISADGIIRTGETTINEASVTGESLPVDKLGKDMVFAGTTNLTGMIEVEVTRIGADTTLGKVRNLILAAESTRLPILRLIDQHVNWYTPTIIMISAIIFFFTKNVEAAITALVVSCPSALVLATPTAMVAGLSCAARVGILIKNVTHLESAGQINAVVFDKTGTLTTGELTVTRIACAEGMDAAEFLTLAASADRHSNHPAARALLKVARKAQVELAEPTDFQEAGGKGVSATVNGEAVFVGRKTFLAEKNVDLSTVEEPTRREEEGYSTLYAARDGKCIGWVTMVDRTRPEARRATEDLTALGMRTLTMLTGDRPGVAERVAKELGCTEFVAECLPEQKLELVEKMKARGLRVAVVGDGVNDAPALAAGDLGVAMGAAGNDVAINSASIALLSDDISRLPFLIRLSRQVRSVVVQNMAFGILFVIAGLAAAGMGMITPVIAALLHNVGSLIVIFNSARVVRFEEQHTAGNV